MASQPEDQPPAHAPVGLHAAEFAAARPVFERAIRVIEAMFGGVAADVVMLVDDMVWRASLPKQLASDRAPGAELVRAGGSVVWIADARDEPLWRDTPAVAGPPYLRFFAGAPIALATGARIGSLQAYGRAPRPFDERAVRALDDLAAFVADECERILLERDLVRAEGEARSARETMAAFVESSPASIVMTDADLRIIRSSPSWRADMKVEGVDVVGQPLDALFPGAADGWADAWATALAGGTWTAERERVLAAGGTQLWLQMKVAPWRDGDGRVAGLLILPHNITEVVESLEQANRSEQRLNLAASLADLHVWELDYRARTLLKMGAHDSFFETPLTYADMFADPFCGVHPDDRERCIEAWERHLATGERYGIEHRVNRRDGKDVWAFTTLEYFADDEGRPLRLVGAMQNITARRNAEAETERAREEAEAANRAKSEFLANMSHEIRTPLNGVMGVAGALTRTELGEDQREMVGLIESSAHTLEVLLSDVLDLARIESGRLELRAEPFDLADALRQTAALFASPARAKGLVFETRIAQAAHARVKGDVVRLRQIVTNLLSNAIKFTTSGSVALDVEAARDRRDQVELRISVSDTGIGFDEEVRSRLFDRFEQADGSITRRYGGTGLGLSISRSLAETMGGVLDASSIAGEGSTFSLSLSLPLAAEDTLVSEPAQGFQPAPDGCRRSVLLAEDHPTNRRVVQLILEGLDVDLTCVEDGAQAVEAAVSGDFDLILMDMQMPVMDGLAATRAIRDLEVRAGERRTPILSLTANAMPEHARASLAAGADGHLTKPIAADQLIAAVLAVTGLADSTGAETFIAARAPGLPRR
jgi:PAS domain S-box-containing protein